MLKPRKMFLIPIKVDCSLMAVQRVVQKSTSRLKILHYGKLDQELTVITFFTSIDWRKNVKQNDNLNENTYELEVRENTIHSKKDEHESNTRYIQLNLHTFFRKSMYQNFPIYPKSKI